MRLIDADKLVMHLADFALSMSGKNEYSTIQQCIKAVEEQPTIDPIKHGRWKLVTDNRGQHFECPHCGEWKYHQSQRYCGNCGCKMDEVSK